MTFRSLLFIGFIGLALAPVACSKDGSSRAKSERPNIIVIVIDALRADHVGAYGHDRATTPNLDQLAGEAVLFEQAFSAANWTRPSTASFFTGLLPRHHGLLVGSWRRESAAELVADVLPAELTTMAELLQQAGYRTRGYSENKSLSDKYGYQQGFGIYKCGKPELAFQLLGEKQARRTFFFFHFLGPHEPYDLKDEPRFTPYRTRFGSFASEIDFSKGGYQNKKLSADDIKQASAMYDAKLNYFDELTLGPFLARLRELGMYDDSWIVVTSDHGEELGDHGYIGHAHALYNESLHVPLLVKPPKQRQPVGARRVPTRVSTISVLATLADVVGIQAPPSDGKSLLPAIDGHALDQGAVIAEYSRLRKGQLEAAAILAGSKKLIRFYHEGRASVLFDLEQDPRETKNLAGEQPEVVRTLERMLAEGFNEQGHVTTITEQAKVPEDEERELNALGYGR